MPVIATYRGELRCFACGRYLGGFESHPALHGRADVHLPGTTRGPPAQHAIQTERSLRCSVCNGRTIAEYIEAPAA